MIKKFLFITALAIGGIVAAMYSQPKVEDLCEGLIISFTASFVFFLYTAVIDSTSTDINNNIESIKNDVSKLESEENTQAENIKNKLEKFDRELRINTNRINENSARINEMIALNKEATRLKEEFGILKIKKREDYSLEY